MLRSCDKSEDKNRRSESMPAMLATELVSVVSWVGLCTPTVKLPNVTQAEFAETCDGRLLIAVIAVEGRSGTGGLAVTEVLHQPDRREAETRDQRLFEFGRQRLQRLGEGLEIGDCTLKKLPAKEPTFIWTFARVSSALSVALTCAVRLALK